MIIPQEILDKYHIGSMEEYESPKEYYGAFLAQTDHIPNKIIESLIETMNDATALDFVARFITWLASTRKEYHDLISYRAFARTQIPEEVYE